MLDAKDRQLLALLDENARYSNAQLARKVQLSKPAIDYRLQRFQKNDAIFTFYTVIDFTKLGFSQYKLYLKLQNVTTREEQEIMQHWQATRGVVWVGQTRGRWDIAISILAQSNYAFGQLLTAFMNKYAKHILEKDILLTEYSPMYAKEQFSESKEQTFTYGKPTIIETLDETDKTILKTISNNARMNIIDIAAKTGLSRDIINYRLKKLKKNGIIVGFRCYPNMSAIGMRLYKIILRMHSFDEAAERKLQAYISQHQQLTQYLKLIGSWDIEIEAETATEDELYALLSDLRNVFSENINNYDLLQITKTTKYDYYPF